MTLEVSDLEIRYGAVRAVWSVSFAAEAGQTTALIGANGAGKTSLLRTVAGLHRPAKGRVTLDGQDVTGQPAHVLARRGLCLVPEGRQLFSTLTVEENLRMGLHGTSVRSPAAVAERMEAAYRIFPALRDAMRRPAGLLSGGQQQMVAIARALMRQPRVLLLDEPSLGLAPRLVSEILNTVRGLAEAGVTVLLAEQNAAAALRSAQRGIILQNGRLVRDAPAAELLADEEVSQHYLGSLHPAELDMLPEHEEEPSVPASLPPALRGPLLRSRR